MLSFSHTDSAGYTITVTKNFVDGAADISQMRQMLCNAWGVSAPNELEPGEIISTTLSVRPNTSEKF